MCKLILKTKHQITQKHFKLLVYFNMCKQHQFRISTFMKYFCEVHEREAHYISTYGLQAFRVFNNAQITFSIKTPTMKAEKR